MNGRIRKPCPSQSLTILFALFFVKVLLQFQLIIVSFFPFLLSFCFKAISLFEILLDQPFTKACTTALYLNIHHYEMISHFSLWSRFLITFLFLVLSYRSASLVLLVFSLLLKGFRKCQMVQSFLNIWWGSIFLFLRPGSNLELYMYICAFVSLVIIDIIK